MYVTHKVFDVQTDDAVTGRARELADELTANLKYDDGYGDGHWWHEDPRLEPSATSQLVTALALFDRYAGSTSEYAKRAREIYDKSEARTTTGDRCQTIAGLLRLWADDIVRGAAKLAGQDARGVRAVASTDVMEQVRALIEDGSVHAAAPIVLAGAALETALRGAVEERGLHVAGAGSISAYGKALRAAEVITKQDVKDIEQMGGLRNAAAHGQFELLSAERAGLMEQQVNMFLARLTSILET